MFATAQDLVDCRIYGRLNSLKEAQLYLDNALQKALANNQGCKHDRPWNIVDFSTKLDPKADWIGFEFETGFDNKAEYQSFVRHLWDQPYTAIDKEGTGNYPVEVAYAPMSAADIKAGRGTLRQSVQFVKDNGLTPALNPTTFTRRDVGIHAGISTPNIRKGGEHYDLSRRLNACLLSLNSKQRVAVYGRSELHWGGCQARTGYIEVKTFRAIPTLEHIDLVEKTTLNIVKLLKYLEANPAAKPSPDGVFKFLSSSRPLITSLK